MFDTARLLDVLTSTDPTRPRITFYDAHGRIELSGKVLANWVHKATNLLVDEFDAQPLDVVVLDLPAGHWRTLYWALAAWATGAHVVVPEPDEQAPRQRPGHAEKPLVVITDRPGAWAHDGAPLVAVEMTPLARSFGGDLPAGAIDEAAELATFPDVADLATPASAGDPACSDRGYQLSYAELVSPYESGRLLLPVTRGASRMQVLTVCLGVLAADGSLVVVDTSADTDGGGATASVDEARLEHIASTEGAVVTRL